MRLALLSSICLFACNNDDKDASDTDGVADTDTDTDADTDADSDTDTDVDTTDTIFSGTTDSTAALDPVCGAVPAPGDAFTVDFGGPIGVHTFEQSGNTGCHELAEASSQSIALYWTSTTGGGFSIGGALFSGKYTSLGSLVGNTIISSSSNFVNSEINAPGVGSYAAIGPNFGVHVVSLTDDGITGCLVDFDAWEGFDGSQIDPASPIPFACSK